MAENPLNKICLGTAQFGFDYGIANTRGKIPVAEVFDILRLALNKGISKLDTAGVYGDSQAVIGNFSSRESFRIVSKLTACGPFEPHVDAWMAKDLQKTLTDLNVRQIDGFLVHDFKNFLTHGRLWDGMRAFRQTGRVKRIGFSLYQPQELELLFNRKIDFDIVQVPYSLFDRRFEPYFPMLKEKGIATCVRSIFLQGLPFMPVGELPAQLKDFAAPLEALNRISREHTISVHALCLNFVLLNEGVDQAIMGVDNLQHLEKNIADTALIDQVRTMSVALAPLAMKDEDILLPNRWMMTGKTQ